MGLEKYAREFLPAVETELQRAVKLAGGEGYDHLQYMLSYHMGWEGEGAGSNAAGKRIRPLLLLLSCAAAGGAWQSALPAAAAVELVHNFSLIHDDIEDNSPQRRGRATVWNLWGVPQAINTGDTMFTLATLALLEMEKSVSPQAALQAVRILKQACLQLTQGQFLDLSYEQRGDLTLTAYWPMVKGKTASLLSACTQLGAVAAGAGEETAAAYRDFGEMLGLAFQALDDLLGIWGDAALTGKSTESDLVSGKKSLPVLYALNQDGPFARRWEQGAIQAHEVAGLAQMLETCGARGYTQETAACMTDEALRALERASPQGAAGLALHQLANQLLSRQS